MFELPSLPYPKTALEPHISKETLEYHYDKHHAAYVNKLNLLLKDKKEWEGKKLEDIMASAEGPIYNNAAQIWNHTFYWNSMKPNGGGEPVGPVKEAIQKDFGSFEKFKEEFSAAAAGHFGSGWAWLIKDPAGKLKVQCTHDAGSPKNPILVCDVWEHAYYIDYRNDRGSYVKAWWNLVNWDWANQQYKK